MLIKFFPKLGDNLIVKYLKQFFECKYSAILIAALTLISNWFSLDLPVFYAFALIVMIASLFCDDLRCLIPLACCMYYPLSRANSSQQAATNSASLLTNFSAQIQLVIIIVVIAIFAIGRLVFELVTKPERRKLPKLTWGFVALGAVYMFGGIFSKYYLDYSLNNFLFGLSQIFAFSFSYFFFYFTVDFTKMDKSYFAYLMTVIGILLCFETLGILYFSGCFTTEGGFSRSNLYTGWGGYNNLAGALIMSLPAPFYYATTQKKYNWLYLLLGHVFFAALLFTQSRSGMLFGACVYALCVVVTIWKSQNRKPLILTEAIILACVGIFCIIFREKIYDIFASVIAAGMNDSGRFNIYIDGLNAFLEAPIFGTGFYSYNPYVWGDNLTAFTLPYRYHNTIVQLLASCGIVGLSAYFYHRYQTVRMIFKKRNVEKYFIGLCILGLLLTSLLDIHLFNFHPGFTYSALLLFLEMDWLRDEPKAGTPVVETTETTETTEINEATETVTSVETTEKTEEVAEQQTEEVTEVFAK